jgi:hypothetical protein
MPKFPVVAIVVASFVSYGCLSSAGSSPSSPEGDAGIADSGPPVQTIDGSVLVDGGGPVASLTTGLGSGIVAHSAHFTLITKTGDEPGGAGLKSSEHFTVVSGAAPAGAGQ